MKKGSAQDGVLFHAGFPNAAEDQAERGFSLDTHVFRHRLSTYLWRLGQAIPETGWQEGSVVVVDKALSPRQGDLVVAIVEEDFVVRKFHQKRLYDLAGVVEGAETVVVWGVITHVLQEYRAL